MDTDPSFDYMPREHQLKLHDSSLRLQREFLGVYDKETINRFLRTSYDEFSVGAESDVYATTFAERFAMARLRAMRAMETRNERDVPIVLVISEHDSARAQIALGYLRNLLGDSAIIWSGGRNPDPVLNHDAVLVMAEDGVDISGAQPKRWNNEIIRAADIVVNIGDHEAVPVFSGRRYVDWEISDPGADPVLIRAARDEIKRRAQELAGEIVVVAQSNG